MSTDLERLQGTWNIVALEVEGQKMPASASTGSKIVIRGSSFTTVSMGAVYDGTIEVDAAATPRTFDLIFTEGPEKGNRSLGIYELDQDAWRICLTLRGNVRPREFATTPQSGLALETLKRAAAVETPAPAPSPAAGAPCEPVPELEGQWSLVSLVRDGVPTEASLLRYGKRVDKCNQVTVSFGPQVVFQASYTADRTRHPNTIDFIHAQTQLGIFELDGTALKLCYGAPGQPRPADYSSTTGDGRTLAVWKRAGN